MNYNHLFYFYTAARMGGVSKAAKVLNISQPSLSMQIKTFESSLGKKLFQKLGRGVQLTVDGEKAYRYSQKIFEAVDDFKSYLKGSDAEPSKIRIGISNQVESPFVADLFSTVYKQNENFKAAVLIASGTQNHLLEQLRLQQIDMLLTNSPAYQAEFQLRAEVDMQVGLFIAKNKFQELSRYHNLPMTFKQLATDYPVDLVLPSVRQKLRHEIDIYLQRFKMKSSISLESDILSVVARGLVDGLGIGFLPIPYVAEEIKFKLLVQMLPQEKFWSHKFYVICRRQEKLDPVLDELIKTISDLEKHPHFFGKKDKKNKKKLSLL